MKPLEIATEQPVHFGVIALDAIGYFGASREAS